jgi:hypothetical protein
MNLQLQSIFEWYNKLGVKSGTSIESLDYLYSIMDEKDKVDFAEYQDLLTRYNEFCVLESQVKPLPYYNWAKILSFIAKEQKLRLSPRLSNTKFLQEIHLINSEKYKFIRSLRYTDNYTLIEIDFYSFDITLSDLMGMPEKTIEMILDIHSITSIEDKILYINSVYNPKIDLVELGLKEEVKETQETL